MYPFHLKDKAQGHHTLATAIVIESRTYSSDVNHDIS